MADTLTFPKVSSKIVRRRFPQIFDLTTIWKVALAVMCFGASAMIAFTVGIPALTGGFERIQLKSLFSTGLYK